jgi:anaerobic dimethyl sulfoxide reductase subunit B
MVRQLGFYVDVGACTGCKACQLACKDKNDLERGRLFRRVIDVEGGDWLRRGDAWLPTVFAYSVSTSCMHCEKPACREACPTGAMTKGEDGVVFIDAGRCIGCRYCEWACPYGAPRYHEAAGRMTECDFCRDLLERQLPPECVEACPMRAIDFGDIGELRARYGSLDAAYPLPDGAITRPALVLTPHRQMAGAGIAASIGNREEL